MINVKEIADNADMIVNNYAFTKEDNFIRVLNLSNPYKSLVLSRDGNIVEACMDDIESSIVTHYYNKNKKYLEVMNDA